MKNTEKPMILAVDDEAVIVNFVASIIKENYNVRPFTSGQKALKYLESHYVDLILIDYEMPGMTGYEVLEKLQEDDRMSKIPVIFLTGSTNNNTEVEVLKKGASDFILKPIKSEVLLTRISLQLELQSYRNHLEALVKEKTENLRAAYEELKARDDLTLNLLARVTDMRDHDTGGHIRRTTEFVRIIVQGLLENPYGSYELTPIEADNIIKSVKLHDLGKIAIPDHILLKPGKLSPEEFDIIKSHPSYGARLLDEFIEQTEKDSFLNTARDISFSHHEKWNGQGYPLGLKETSIPLSARIAAIADVYDALTSSRPYKIPFSHLKAVEIIENDSGAHFDPYLVQVFLRLENEFKAVASHDI